MKSPDGQTPVEMNWVDYCDALSNASFALRMQPPKTARASEHGRIPDHSAFVSSVREAVRDLV
jgi:hypothetical protein